MIALTGLTKCFHDSKRPVVDALSLTVPAGEICALIGPSGCGKTTTLRLVNRMIEPDAGVIAVAGRDVTHVDPVNLRRSIGYVIQQIGLFPHLTIADNIATVPQLLGWDKARIAQRTDELLTLVGMDPDAYRRRFPRDLSGGQRQRIGVARALAADPPVMLMDEPFGAIDPINRSKLQDEFLHIQRRLRKTILFVTHDIHEAIRMGNRIAIMRSGKLVQYDTPEAILARPADPFVEEFVGSDRLLKRLSLLYARDYMQSLPGAGARSVAVPSRATLLDALTLLLASGAEAATVTDESGTAVGSLTLDRIRAAIPAQDTPAVALTRRSTG